MAEQQRRFFAVTTPGLEQICADEMAKLGFAEIEPIHGGVGFVGELRELYLANLWLRTASRILVRLGDFTARDFPTLHKKLVRLPWGRYLKPGVCCDIRVAVHQSRLFHSGRVGEVCCQAIEKALGESMGTDGAVQQVLLRLDKDRVEVSIDSSGEHLHRRGYQRHRGEAPLRENLAAAALLSLGYDGTQPLLDVMTGSGTFVIEGALIALHRPPGAQREFAFMHWPKYRPGLWQQLLLQAQGTVSVSSLAPIIGVDSNPKVVEAAHKNLQCAGVEQVVTLQQERLQMLTPQAETGFVVGNPPYGTRLGRNARLEAFYHDLERLYAETFRNWRGMLLCPDEVVRAMPLLKLTPLLRFSHGGIRVCVWATDERVKETP